MILSMKVSQDNKLYRKKLEERMLKLNWDAVVDNKGSSTGIGVVA